MAKSVHAVPQWAKRGQCVAVVLQATLNFPPFFLFLSLVFLSCFCFVLSFFFSLLAFSDMKMFHPSYLISSLLFSTSSPLYRKFTPVPSSKSSFGPLMHFSLFFFCFFFIHLKLSHLFKCLVFPIIFWHSYHFLPSLLLLVQNNTLLSPLDHPFANFPTPLVSTLLPFITSVIKVSVVSFLHILSLTCPFCPLVPNFVFLLKEGGFSTPFLSFFFSLCHSPLSCLLMYVSSTFLSSLPSLFLSPH